MIELTPQQAASIAQNVYNVLPVVQDIKQVDLGIDNLSLPTPTRAQASLDGVTFSRNDRGSAKKECVLH